MLGPALLRLGTPIGIDLAGNGGFDRVSLGHEPTPFLRIAAGVGNTTWWRHVPQNSCITDTSRHLVPSGGGLESSRSDYPYTTLYLLAVGYVLCSLSAANSQVGPGIFAGKNQVPGIPDCAWLWSSSAGGPRGTRASNATRRS